MPRIENFAPLGPTRQFAKRARTVLKFGLFNGKSRQRNGESYAVASVVTVSVTKTAQFSI